jgi:uncharacterized protein YjbI with pentapeptide repeats
MKNANLEWAYLGEGPFLEGAHMEGADLRGATYNDETEWEGAFYTKGDNGTQWPDENFDPEAKGCILVEA